MSILEEFGKHMCDVCGTDCIEVEAQIADKGKRIAALQAQIDALRSENQRYRKALEYCIVLDNLYVGDSFRDQPKGSDGAHLSNIWGQMIDHVDCTLNPPAELEDAHAEAPQEKP